MPEEIDRQIDMLENLSYDEGEFDEDEFDDPEL